MIIYMRHVTTAIYCVKITSLEDAFMNNQANIRAKEVLISHTDDMVLFTEFSSTVLRYFTLLSYNLYRERGRGAHSSGGIREKSKN